MSLPEKPQPVKLISSILTGDPLLITAALDEMVQRFGETDFISPLLDFDFTDYYEQEMGKGLVRQIAAFKQLICPDELPDIKRCTVSLEGRFVNGENRRRVNIDPGYIALPHLILATCKSFSHRPYLQKGIYADVTLMFRGNTFTPLPWTFPDYGSEPMITILNTIREIYHRQLKKS